MKRTVLGVLIALCLISLARNQNFAGGVLPHLHTGIATAELATQLQQNYQYSFALGRSPFSAGEQTVCATALRDYSIIAVPKVAGNLYYVHIEILNASLSATKKNFQFYLNLTHAQRNVLNVAHKVRQASFHYICIGTQFSGYYDSSGIPSMYIFARNSPMITPAASGETLLDFKNPDNQLSPFSYDPSNAAYQGCGAVKRNGNWILETEKCLKITATLFITGFDFNAPPDGNNDVVNTVALGAGTLTDLQKDLRLPADVYFSPDTTKDGIRQTFDPAKQKELVMVQPSVVVVALREYTTNTYPVQGTYIDNFSANTFIDKQPDSTATGATTTFDVQTTAAPYYPVFDATKFGHRFCGLNQYSFQYKTDPAGNLDGFVLPGPQPNPVLTAPAANTITINPKDPALAPTLGASYSCIAFVSSAPCVESSRALTFSAPSVVINPTTAASVTFTGAVSSSPYASSGGPNILTPVLPFSQQTFTAPGTIVYTTTVPLTDVKVGAYEGVLYLAIDNAVTTATQETVKVEVFGNVVVQKTIDIPANSKIPLHFGFENNNPTNNNIVLTFTSTTGAQSINGQFLEFGLFAHDNVISSNQTCVTSCVPVAGYTTGIDFTTSPPTCINCDTSLNLVYDSVSGSCLCAPGYYTGTTGCVVCSVTLCGACTTDTTGCTGCVPNAHFVSATDPKQGCVCNDGYYKSNNQCLPCASGCAICAKGTECTTCVASSNTRAAPALNCACLNGTYDAGTPVCPACSPECLTCSVSAINCTSCNTTGFFNLTGTTCQCINGYYMATVAGVPQCLKCHFSCANCTNDAAFCLDCKSNMWTKLSGGQCICNRTLKYVYYANEIIDGICIDQQCINIDPQCVECSIVTLTGQNICKRCNQAANWTLAANNISCVCRSGFVNINNTCVACGAGCQVCTTPATCDKCADGGTRLTPATCGCQPGLYLTNMYGPLQCLACDPNCAQCQVTSSTCTSCINGFNTINNACVCPPNRFQTGWNCNICTVGCATCATATTCSNCMPSYILSNGICVLNCPAGSYNGGDQCFQCSEGCRNCNSFLDCRSCNTGLYLYLGSCVATCPTGFLPYANTLCVACSDQCASCSGTPANCLTCAGNRVLSGNQCLTGCPVGQFFNGAQCASCSPPCTACEAAATQCTACPQGQYLYRGQCTATCPTTVVAGVCQNICNDGFFLNGTACQRCNANCQTCTSLTACTSCRTPLLNSKGNCVASCPANTIISGGSCLDCDATCSGCSGSTTSCINCAPGTYRLAERCYTTCPISYYTDLATITCKKCDANCKTCSGPGLCTVCLDNSAPVGGLCAVNCGANCLECQGSTCTRCAPNFYWNGQACQAYCPAGSTASNGVCVCPAGLFINLGSCVSSCPPEFVNVNSQCRSCENPCRTCSTSTTSCDSCIEGYSLDAVSRRCTRSSACSFGQYVSTFADCKFICPEGTYYLDSACYVSRCPAGFTTDDSKRICVRSTLPSGCNSPLFLQGSNCVSVCDAGSYPDSTIRVCLPCSSNCVACSGPAVCTSCAAGSTLSNGLCVIQADSCPPGQSRYNDICLASCPAGTFSRDGFCVRLCAANLYYWNGGCYDSCPTGLNTAEACTLVCGVGFRKEGNTCVPTSSQSCAAGQYYNTAIGVCDNCRYPCATCSGSAAFCTTCAPNFNLRNGVCTSVTTCQAGFYASQSGCQRCSAKCATCSDLNVCNTCSPGYTNTGADCVISNTPLNPVTLTVMAVVKNANGNVVFIQIQPNILPNNIPSSLASQILLFVPTSPTPNPASQVNIWVASGMIFVALTHTGGIPTYRAALVLNSNVFDSMYRSMGYSTANSFVEVPISSNIPTAPINISIPPGTANSKVLDERTLSRFVSTALNSRTFNAIRDSAKAL